MALESELVSHSVSTDDDRPDRAARCLHDLLRFIVTPFVCLSALGDSVDRDIQIPASPSRDFSTAGHEPPAGTPPATRSTTATDTTTGGHPGRSGRASA